MSLEAVNAMDVNVYLEKIRCEWMEEESSLRPKALGKRVEVGDAFNSEKEMETCGEDILKLIEDAVEKVKTLELNRNSHSLAFSTALAPLLARMSHLERLLFNDMWVGRKIPEIHPALKLFAGALINNDRLTVIDFSDNAVNPDGSTNIAPLLSVCTSLKELYLNNTGVGPAGGKTIGEALLACYHHGVRTNKPFKLEKFILGRSRLEVDGCKAVSRAFCHIKTLREIRINNNGIFTEAFVDFANAIACNQHLEIIDVSDNHVKTRGGLAIAKALSHCPKLRMFLASDVGLKNRAGKKIVEALADSSIEILNLAYNDMGPLVRDAMLISLAGRPLKYVDIQGNFFGRDGYESVFSSLGCLGPDEEDADIESDEDDDMTDDETEYNDDVIALPDTDADAEEDAVDEEEEEVDLDVLNVGCLRVADKDVGCGVVTALPLSAVASALLRSSRLSSFLPTAIEAYLLHPKSLAMIFFDLCNACETSSSLDVLDAYLEHITPSVGQAFLNEVFVGLGLMKPEFRFVYQQEREQLSDVLPADSIQHVWTSLERIVVQDYFTPLRETFLAITSDQYIKDVKKSFPDCNKQYGLFGKFQKMRKSAHAKAAAM
eukprot:m.26693 g.26693  ORF g.26693 m.26693 type:complete len:604 (+) comp9289_c0_seq2:69-1880(+)